MLICFLGLYFHYFCESLVSVCHTDITGDNVIASTIATDFCRTSHQVLLLAPKNKSTRVSFLIFSPFSSNLQFHINEKSNVDIVEMLMQMFYSVVQNAMKLKSAVVQRVDSVVSDVQDDDSVDGGIRMKVEALEASMISVEI